MNARQATSLMCVCVDLLSFARVWPGKLVSGVLFVDVAFGGRGGGGGDGYL